MNLSICIVVRNAAADLSLTLASIGRHLECLSQLPAEVVVVDGNSSDASLKIAEKWAEHSCLSVALLSQQPRGIYPAMNLAWRRAQGKWLLFINAGDLLLDARPLAQALYTASISRQKSIQFESALFMPGASTGFWRPGSFPACHQALVYQRELHEIVGPYDERFRICADRLFDYSMRAYGLLLYPRLLSATQVSPANTSRSPDLLSRDLAVISELCLPVKPLRIPWLSHQILKIERCIGISISVWMKLALLQLVGRARKVSLG